MFGVRLQIRPTSGLTFRRVPFSTLEMLTYPFVPPTTLSGYLDRVVRLARGEDLPEASHEHPEFFALPRAYRVLGALPSQEASIAYSVLNTTRQGIRKFQHTAFSKLRREGDKENYQLYRWEYLFAEGFTGYVVHEDEAALSPLTALTNYGCKLGKEGWAYVERVDGPFSLERSHMLARPSTLVPATEVFDGAVTLYPLYCYAWQETSEHVHDLGRGPAPIAGFVPFLAAVMDGVAEMDFWVGDGAHLPAALLDYV